MKPKLHSYVAIVLASAVLVFSCKKGDTGPAGPAGPAGQNGTAGPQGPKGDSGSANVIYSAWMDGSFVPDLVIQDPNDNTKLDTLEWADTLNAPKLTSAILNQGSIKVYFNAGTATNQLVIPVPYSDVFINISAQFVVGKIFLYSSQDLSTQVISGAKAGQWRYVIIPGSVPASVNTKDYNSVKNYFKMPD